MTSTEEKTLLYKVLGFIATTIITVSIAVSGYFINQNIQAINDMQKDIVQLKLNDEKVNNNRFSSVDWNNNKALLDADRLAMDRRIITLEQSIPVIKESLLEIKETLKERVGY